MTPLSGIDSAFLYLEAPATPMHVASLHVEKSHLAKLPQPVSPPPPDTDLGGTCTLLRNRR